MKVRCTDNRKFEIELTVGKIYEARDDGMYYSMADNNGNKIIVSQARFQVIKNKEKEEEKTIKVRCINNINFQSSLTFGKIYNVWENHSNSYRFINDKGEEGSCYKSRFEVVENEKQEENAMDKKREFNFVLPSVCAFSRQEWTNDLSKENPLIVFRVNGYTDFMIHESVVKKINYLKLRMPELTNTDHDISVLAEFVKSVKAKNWNDEKACVKIVIPKI